MLSLRSEFTYGISHHIVPGCARFGTIDDTGQLQLIVATTTNKVIIHDNETVLNINEKIRALEVTTLNKTYDVIIVGTASGILIYDAYSNTTLVQRELIDGINCIQVGNFNTYDKLIFCGGNCAIWGLDVEGKDAFWTVTGDNVLSLCLSDIDNDGSNELVVGTESFDIRIFKNDLLLYEMNETDAIIGLCDLGDGIFAYALINGTLGAYSGNTRLWRIKSKSQAVALIQFPDPRVLVCAWIHGKVDIRDPTTGEVKLKESANCQIATTFISGNQLVVVSTDGNVNGFIIDKKQGGTNDGQDLLHKLNLQRYDLLSELQNYEQCRNDATSNEDEGNEMTIPANTILETSLAINNQSKAPSVELQLMVSSDAIIRAVILFAEGIFDGESYVIHPTENYSSCVAIQLRPLRDVAVDLHIKAFVGYAESTRFHVFEVTRNIPRFVMYVLNRGKTEQPEGKAEFQINERPPRLALWINSNFLLNDEIPCKDEFKLTVNFISLRNDEPLIVEMDENGKVVIQNNDIELVGNIIQSIAESFGISEIQTTAYFPREIAELNDITEKLQEMYIMRDRLSATIAERSNSIKEMLVRAEDARTINQFRLMIKYYQKMHALNQAMIAEHKIRCSNHEELLKLLRNLNKIIEQGSRLRVGAPASRLISACRNAIVEEHFDMLQKIILFGV
uniref:Bardet-Biedl syndrome 2 protein homolog n=1 Tax=Elaeophora elaphi TaxID=1147741 RepID=A0A0R3RVV6_9BILA